MHMRAGLIAACVLLAFVRTVAAQTDPAFTAQERSKLAAGDLVTRRLNMQRTGNSLLGGTSWQVIDAPLDVVWQALHDIARYPKTLPAVSEARLAARQGDHRIVNIRHRLWPFGVAYFLSIHSDLGTRTIDFALDDTRPRDIESAVGFVRVVRYDDKRTLVAFGVLAVVGHGIIASVTRPIIQTWMLRVPSTLKKFLESGGQRLYQRVEREPFPDVLRGATAPP